MTKLEILNEINNVKYKLTFENIGIIERQELVIVLLALYESYIHCTNTEVPKLKLVA